MIKAFQITTSIGVIVMGILAIVEQCRFGAAIRKLQNALRKDTAVDEIKRVP